MKKLFEQKYFIFVLLLAAIVISKMHLDHASNLNIYGLADTKETIVSTRVPVVIRKIHVFQGQKIRRGELLVETENPDLALQLLQLQSQLSELSAKSQFNLALNEHLRTADIKMNKKGKKNKKVVYTNPLKFQIKSLKKQIRLLEREMSGLNIYADSDSNVAAVNVKEGEKMAAFAPLLSLIKNTPLFVRGYIHESIKINTFKQQKVLIRAVSDPNRIVMASVAEIGDRIVNFPEQLLRGDQTLSWGRELIIALPINNFFRVGEKLIIQLTDEKYALDLPIKRKSGLLTKTGEDDHAVRKLVQGFEL